MRERSSRVCGQRLRAAVLISLVVAACAEERGNPVVVQASTVHPTVADSAGIRIVSYADMPPLEPFLKVATRPVVTIGDTSSDSIPELIELLIGATILDNDLLALVLDGDSAVRIYGADGKSLRSIGRRGEGPGEFRGIMGICSLGQGRLAVLDANGARISIVNATGSKVDPHRLPIAGGLITGCMQNGSIVMLTRPREIRSEDQAIWYSADGRPLVKASILRFAGSEPVFVDKMMPVSSRDPQIRLKGGFIVAPPFAKQISVTPDIDRIHMGDGSEFSVVSYTTDWRVSRILRVETPQPRMSSKMKREQRKVLSKRAPPKAQSEWRRWLKRPEAFPAALPAYRRLIVDDARRLWVELVAAAPDSSIQWYTFDADGRVLGSVHVPRELRILQVHNNRVLVTRAIQQGGIVGHQILVYDLVPVGRS